MKAPQGPKYLRAREYILENPEESKQAQAAATGVSTGVIALVRRDLIKDGLLKPSRKESKLSSSVAPLVGEPASNSKAREMLNHQAMERLAAMVDALMDDDEAVQRRLVRQCLLFTFDPELHPDTRMSASKMYQTIKERQKEISFGPGVPKTRETAVGRLSDMMVACGPSITLEAVNKAFTVEGPSGETGQAPPPS